MSRALIVVSIILFSLGFLGLMGIISMPWNPAALEALGLAFFAGAHIA